MENKISEEEFIKKQEKELFPASQQLNFLQKWLDDAVHDKKIRFNAKQGIYSISSEKDLQTIYNHLNSVCIHLNEMPNKKLHPYAFDYVFRLILNDFYRITQSLRLNYWNIFSNKLLKSQVKKLDKETFLESLSGIIQTFGTIISEFSCENPFQQKISVTTKKIPEAIKKSNETANNKNETKNINMILE